jgi:phytoene dehydrogenase-like protein
MNSRSLKWFTIMHLDRPSALTLALSRGETGLLRHPPMAQAKPYALYRFDPSASSPTQHGTPPLSIETEAKKERYDVVVIGSGIGGLSAAALLAKAGKSVLVVERHRRPGGCAHGFSRGRLRFDSGVHLVSGCGSHGYADGRIIGRILQALALESPFHTVDPWAKLRFPGLAIDLPSGEEAFLQALDAAFPGHRDGLRDLLRLCRSVAEELVRAEEVMEREGSVSLAGALPQLFRYRKATLAGVLAKFLPDRRLQNAIAGLWPYLGLPPSRLSFLAWATMWAGYVYEGGYYCAGSFQQYADLLAHSLRQTGGELLLNASVRRILTDAGEVSGVMLDNNLMIRADAVISNADMRQTAELLLGRERLPPGYWAALEGLSSSLSVFVTYLATDLPLPEDRHAHETFQFDGFDHDEAYRKTLAGSPDWMTVTVPTLADPALAPPGQHLMLLTQLSPFQCPESWKSAKMARQRDQLARAEQIHPGLRDHLLFVESGSPRTVERYTLNHQGAAYGWALTPEQCGARRPAVKGPVNGLYFAGHGTRPGGGVTGVSHSGVLAAQALLGIKQREDFWRLFR